jgi:hypothetical protein
MNADLPLLAGPRKVNLASTPKRLLETASRRMLNPM